MIAARANKSPMVIDADGIFAVCQDVGTVQSYKNVILTPNVNEFKLLYNTVFRKFILKQIICETH